MSDMLLAEYNPKNVMARLNKLERDLHALRIRRVEVSQLSLISDDLGVMPHGFLTFMEGDASNPENPDNPATGVGMGFPGWLLQGTTWGFIGFRNGVLQFGASIEDGEIYAAGGYLRIGAEAMVATGLLYSYRHTATNDGETRQLSFGLDLAPGTVVPSGAIVFAGAATGGEQLANGDFESGDFTDWTKTSEVGGIWEIDTTNPHGGSYLARFIMTSTTAPTAVLTYGRKAVTAGDRYRFSLFYRTPTTPDLVSLSLQVKWYDDPTAGALLQTDTIYLNASTAWLERYMVLVVPAGAQSCAVVSSATSGLNVLSGTVLIYIDDISMIEVDIATALRFRPWVSIEGGPGQLERQITLPAQADANFTYITADQFGAPIARDDAGRLYGLAMPHGPGIRVQNTTTKSPIYQNTIWLDDHGWFHLLIPYYYYNETGSNRTFNIDVDFDSTNILTYTTTAIGSNANNRVGTIALAITWSSTGPFARCHMVLDLSNASSTPTRGNVLDIIRRDLASYSMPAAGGVFTVSITLSNAHSAHLFQADAMKTDGPNNGF